MNLGRRSLHSRVPLSATTEDIKIHVARRERMDIETMGRLWARFNLSSPSDPTNDPDQAASSAHSTLEEQSSIRIFIDLDLCRAVTEDDVDGFRGALERIMDDQKLPLCAIFKQVSPSGSGNTLLHIAASVNNRIMAPLVQLIAHKAPWLLSEKNSKGDTLLHVLARAGYKDTESLVSFLNGSESSSAGNGHITEFRKTLARLLMDQNDEGNTCLHEALIHGNEGLTSLFLSVIELERDNTPLFCLNNEQKSPLYLATETRSYSCLQRMLERITVFENQSGRLRGKSPFHAAIMKRNTDVLGLILEKKPDWILYQDEEQRNPLHWAASMGYLEGVRNLLGKNTSTAMDRDKHGFFPIHMASAKGHVHVIRELLQHWPYVEEMQNSIGQNILHVAATSGKLNVIKYILETPGLESLINGRDKDGNTPLHLATMHWHPKLVSALTWDNKVDLRLVNNDGLTALDIAECYIENSSTFRQRLTWTALKAAGVPRNPNASAKKQGSDWSELQGMPRNPNASAERQGSNWSELQGMPRNPNASAERQGSDWSELQGMPRNPNASAERQGSNWSELQGVPRNPNASVEKQGSNWSELQSIDNYKDRVNTLLLVSTLVATVTFTAGFTIPGGYNSSGEDQGMATMLSNNVFHAFIFCNTIAMFSSIFVAVTLIWAQLGDTHLVLTALRAALPLLGVALATMSLAFLAGIYLVVSKLGWLANAIVIMGSVFWVALLSLYFFLCFPMSSSNRIMRYISYYPFCLLLVVTGSAADNDFEE